MEQKFDNINSYFFAKKSSTVSTVNHHYHIYFNLKLYIININSVEKSLGDLNAVK